MSKSLEGVIRVRISSGDVHYAGGLVDGAFLVKLFGDAITELLIRHDGDEGLSRMLRSEYLAPVRAGDYLEIRAKLVAVGKSSRTIECTAHKLVAPGDSGNSAADFLAQPILVATATDVAVVPAARQRGARKVD